MERDSEKETAPAPPVGASERATVTADASISTDRRRTLDSSRGRLERLPVGTELGRYVILELRGVGGMGAVYAAYDPKLDRRVALKLIHPDAGDAEDAGARLLREAQALAKLAHPNVVTVHDAGVLGDRVFVEMEFVDGQTLDDWSKGRSHREILGAYLQAARALSAAHAADLVHRDFKPSNAIVDNAGRVRVLDFGLARPVGDAGASLRPPPPPSSDPDVVRAPASARSAMPTAAAQSVAGFAVGTPAFMPPEQWAGRQVDARADQYAFAASLYESLYGALPFPSANRTSMRSPEARGPVPERPPDSKVPAYVHRALVRALAFAPDDRFRSMDELVHALERDPVAAARRRVTTAVAAVAVLAAAGLAIRYEHTRDARACAATADRLAGAWDDEKARAVHEALTKSGAPSAEDTWTRTRAALDAYASSWVGLRTTACEEARRGKGADDAEVGARLVCLDWRLDELRALTNVLASEPDAVHDAVEAVSNLTPADRCTSPRLRGLVRPPDDPAVRARVDAVRERVADAESRRLAGKPKAARPIAKAASEEARATGHRPAEAAALLALGRAEMDDGDYKGAAVTLEDALWAAEAAGDDLTLTTAATKLLMVVGYRLQDHANVARWERHALAALERLGAPDAAAAELDDARSAVARQRQDLSRSRNHGCP